MTLVPKYANLAEGNDRPISVLHMPEAKAANAFVPFPPQGSRLATQDLATIHIDHIPENFMEETVINMCRYFGNVVNSRFLHKERHVRTSPISWSNISFSTPEHADAALMFFKKRPLGLRAAPARPRAEIENKKAVEEKARQLAISRLERLSEFERKRGIGQMSFNRKELTGLAKDFQDVARSHLVASAFLMIPSALDNLLEKSSTFFEPNENGELQTQTKKKRKNRDEEMALDLSAFKSLTIGSKAPQPAGHSPSYSSSCASCSQKSRFLCRNCRIITYCSLGCQSRDWLNEHRMICSQIEMRRIWPTENSQVPELFAGNCSPGQSALSMEDIHFKLYLDDETFTSCHGFASGIMFTQAILDKVTFDMQDFYFAKQSEGDSSYQVTEVSSGMWAVALLDNSFYRIFILNVSDEHEVSAVKIDYALLIDFNSLEIPIFKLSPEFYDPSLGLICQPLSVIPVDQAASILDASVDPNGHVNMRINEKEMDKSGRLLRMKCSLLDASTSAAVAEYLVFPWHQFHFVQRLFDSKPSGNDVLPIRGEQTKSQLDEKVNQGECDVVSGDRSDVTVEPEMEGHSSEFSIGEQLKWLNFSQKSNQIFVARIDDNKTMKKILKELHSKNLKPLKQIPNVDDVVACQHKRAGAVPYRGRVCKVSRFEVEVWLMDCGEAETFGLDEIFQLPSSISDLPALAKLVHLSGVTPNSLHEGRRALALAQLRPLLCAPLTVTKVAGRMLTLRHPSGRIINEVIEQKQHEETFFAVQGQKPGGSFDFDFCHLADFADDPNLDQVAHVGAVVSPNQIYLVPCNQIGVASYLMEQIQNYAAALDSILSPVAHHVYLARWPEDNQWYRVVSLGDDDVFFADFGFQAKIPPNDFRPIPESLMVVPFMAVWCALDGFEEASDPEDKAYQGFRDLFPPSFRSEVVVRVVKKIPEGSVSLVTFPALQEEINEFIRQRRDASLNQATPSSL